MHPSSKGTGKAFAWLEAHKGYPHKDWCLVWPFYRNRHGQGTLTYMGKSQWAHRLMCNLVYGDPAEPDLVACHNCGKGHEGCVNPNHLQWKTVLENVQDRYLHNNILVRHGNGTARRLTPDQVNAIKSARGFRTRQELSAQFGVSERAVSSIWNDYTYRGDRKVIYWTPEQDTMIREAAAQKVSFAELGRRMGKSTPAVQTRAARLGVKSGHEQVKRT